MNQRYNLDNRHAPFNKRYLERMWMVLNNAIDQYPRTLAVIAILRLPEYRDIDDSISNTSDHNGNVISRFIESLKEKITAYQNRKVRRNIRVHYSELRYAWVREYDQGGKPHYHIALFFNHDAFNTLGNYRNKSDNLGTLIENAWLSALSLSAFHEYRTLVHFPDNPLYYLHTHSTDFIDIYNSLTFRLSYFAKERSKIYSRDNRSFGCSQR
ncbi:inovirus Gp2 family protein [Salmonella enterica]|uniref:Inovirus Gp2 family protein n=3 Tax=Salmonella enterica subsp. salamae TaxID=59202 RepID=A0A5Y2LQJ2_SALER|nr:inovirus Gp2 family protein [Salmonella enterica]EAA4435930.1 inovirus Gp2 family protein [Salmonella enterica subsp. salamae]ECG1419210.1 inovirus Gp2 family protein [Salmonella enterica subsp. salamae str. CFSAN000559]EAB2013154.1 inovirus Gp2 family protein [Salmonella enterica]EAM5459108.1 inovirus Gp2 family protein [Salmonella enterica]EAO6762901.1 inovirus Gp2 family protein [Salmonella enterica]